MSNIRISTASGAVAIVMAFSGCGGPQDQASIEDFCSDIASAIVDTESAFEAGRDEEIEFKRQLTVELREIVQTLPESAPALLADLIEEAASGVEMSVRFADGETLENLAADAEESLERVRAVDWEPAEAWVQANCGIDVLGIQLYMRDDDRVDSSPTTASN